MAFGSTGISGTVYIPKNVEYIGYNPFIFCNKITEFVVDEDNLKYKSIDGVLVDKIDNVIISFPCGKNIDSYVIPEEIRKIGVYAFGESKLKRVLINDNITDIGVCAFCDSSIESLYIGKKCRYIGIESFSRCKKLNEIIINRDDIHIDFNAFENAGVNGGKYIIKKSLYENNFKDKYFPNFEKYIFIGEVDTEGKIIERK